MSNSYIQDLHRELSLAGTQIDSGETEPHNMQDIIDELKSKQKKQWRSGAYFKTQSTLQAL